MVMACLMNRTLWLNTELFIRTNGLVEASYRGSNSPFEAALDFVV